MILFDVVRTNKQKNKKFWSPLGKQLMNHTKVFFEKYKHTFIYLFIFREFLFSIK